MEIEKSNKVQRKIGNCLKRQLFGDFAFSQDGVTDWVYSPPELVKNRTKYM